MSKVKQFVGRMLKPAFAAAAILFLAMAVWKIVRDVKTVPTVNIGWLLFAALLFVGHYFMQAIGWHMILRGLKQQVQVGESIRIWYGSLVARWIPGPLVYSAARLVAAREAGLSVTAVGFGVVLELSYVLLGSMATTLLFSGKLLPSLMDSAVGRSFAVGGLIALVLGGVTALRPGTFTSLCKIPLFRKVVRKVAGEDLPEQGLPVMGIGTSLGLLAYYTAFWIYSGWMFGVLAHSIMPMGVGQWEGCVSAFSGSWLAGFLSVLTPAGLGVREGVMWLMLQPVMAHSNAVLLAVASRLMMLLIEFLSVSVVWVHQRITGAPPSGRDRKNVDHSGTGFIGNLSGSVGGVK